MQYGEVTYVMAHNQHTNICSRERKKANETFEEEKVSDREAQYSHLEQI